MVDILQRFVAFIRRRLGIHIVMFEQCMMLVCCHIEIPHKYYQIDHDLATDLDARATTALYNIPIFILV
jgi:hypothetical protein